MSLVEVIVGVSILALTFTGLITAYNRYVKASTNILPTIKASYLLEEGIEVMKIFRDTSWNTYIAGQSTSTSFSLTFSTSTSLWSTTTANSLIDSQFYRTVALTGVRRDTNNDISTTTGSYDSNTRKVTVTVSWRNGSATTTRTLSTYLTNMFQN